MRKKKIRKVKKQREGKPFIGWPYTFLFQIFRQVS
jgi:hypothetical protein